MFAIKSSILSNFMGSTIDLEKQMEERSGGLVWERAGGAEKSEDGGLGLLSVKN